MLGIAVEVCSLELGYLVKFAPIESPADQLLLALGSLAYTFGGDIIRSRELNARAPCPALTGLLQDVMIQH